MRVSPRAQVLLIPIVAIALSVLVAGLASIYSLTLGIVALFLAPLVLTFVGHNYEPFGAKLREKNDAIMFEWCEAGGVSVPRSLYRHLPANPRCRLCLIPFGGLGRILRISPSRKNPNFCTSCIDGSPEGVHDMEIGVLFADIRGFTAWSSSQPASEAAERVTQFYELAGRVLMKDDTLVEFVGDQVMALYLPSFPSLRERTADTMLAAAQRLIREVKLDWSSDPLRIGVGMNFGVASIGNIRKGGEKDFTAVGDVVNTAARFQAAASPGEIVVGDALFEKFTTRLENAKSQLLEVKGKSEALPVHVLQLN